ncbi:hypothetical protein V5738_14885 [Salinisphaera sp. SPP-AMP-43]|uniref:hypothetical protein n=1 Tax=Salinisphaera sp. SPP-AMP-43 TaxID=3121288 RepID=UPI003C6E0EEA
MTSGSQRRRRLAGASVLAIAGLLAAVYFGYGARDRALDQAADQARGALTAGLDDQARRGRLQARVARWIEAPDVDAVYLTVTGPDGRLLASAGRWSHWLDGRVSSAAAERWRARLYRSLCAEGRRSFVRAPDSRPATLRLGVSWWHVLLGAGFSFWLAVVLGVLGLGLAAIERVQASGTDDSGDDRMTSSTDRLSRRWSAIWRALAKRMGERPVRRPTTAATGRSAGEFEPIGRRVDTPPAAVSASEPAAVDTEAVPPVEPPPVPGAPESVEPETVAPVPDDDAAVPEPMFRFLPLWRGAAGGLLAGAFVTLARPDAHAESPWISIEQLADSSRDQAEQSALTRWLAQRLATFQANWQALELPRIPLFVVVPPALFDFDGAQQTWEHALQGFEQAAEDLVLCVEHLPETMRRSLPVRWAVVEHRPDQPERYRLVLQDSVDSARVGEVDTIRLPKPDAPATGSAQQPLAPREFARLLGERELAPL